MELSAVKRAGPYGAASALQRNLAALDNGRRLCQSQAGNIKHQGLRILTTCPCSGYIHQGLLVLIA